MTATLLTIDGTVSIRERILVPEDSVATVKLVDSTGEVLAATAVAADGVPVAFSLVADPGLLPAEGTLLLWAALRTDVGLWGTADLVPVSDSTADLILAKIPDADEA